jgi:hypothetical protein
MPPPELHRRPVVVGRPERRRRSPAAAKSELPHADAKFPHSSGRRVSVEELR